MQNTDAIATVTSIPAWVVYACLPSLGAVATGILLYYSLGAPKNKPEPEDRKRHDILELAQLLSTLPVSAFLGAIAEWSINTRSVDLTAAEASVLALFGSLATIVSFGIVILFRKYLWNPSVVCATICITVLLPIYRRYGPRCAGLTIRHIFIHKDRTASLEEYWIRFNADTAWDEYATALASALNALKPASMINKAFVSLISPNGEDSLSQHQLTTASEQLLNMTLSEALGKFNAHTGCNKFRFSVWRIDADKQNAERIWSLPESDARPAVSLWGENKVGIAHSHAAHIMMENKPDVFGPEDMRDFPRGRLGSQYTMIRGNPIHAPGEQSPWGVLYIDRCHGSVPLDSDATALLARKLVAAVEPLSSKLKLHTIHEAVHQQNV